MNNYGFNVVHEDKDKCRLLENYFSMNSKLDGEYVNISKFKN